MPEQKQQQRQQTIATSNAPSNTARVPNVKIIQDESDQPIQVKVMQDNSDEPSLRLFAAVIFLASFLGTIIGVIVDSGELIDTIDQFQSILNPPTELCIAGSNTMLGEVAMGPAWESEFLALKDNEIRVSIDGIGSTNGAQRAINGGCVHVLAMSEPIPQPVYSDLINAGYTLDCAAEVGFDVIAFVTNINNPIFRRIPNPENPTGPSIRARTATIQDREMRQILSGEIQQWDEIQNWPSSSVSRPITIFARIGSGTTDVVLSRWARGFTPTQETPLPPGANYLPCDDNIDCLNRTLSTPGSLYWVSVAWMRTQPEDYLRVISILQGDETSVNPILEELELEEYPADLIRPLYLYVLDHENISDEANQLGRDFVTFARGVQGQQAVDEAGFYNHFSRPVDIDVAFPEPFFTIQGGSTRAICKPRA